MSISEPKCPGRESPPSNIFLIHHFVSDLKITPKTATSKKNQNSQVELETEMLTLNLSKKAAYSILYIHIIVLELPSSITGMCGENELTQLVGSESNLTD